MISRRKFLNKVAIGSIAALYPNLIFSKPGVNSFSKNQFIHNQYSSIMNFNNIPKIENHLHLEGAIPYETLWQLIQKYGGDDTVADLNQLKEKFKYRDFSHFIEMWIWNQSCRRHI